LSNPAHGTLSPSGTLPFTLPANGNIVSYTPATGYYGQDSFTFKANNGADSTVQTVTLRVNNTPPTVQNQTVTVSEGGNVPITFTATQASSAPITYTVVSCPAHGTLNGIVSCPATLAGNTVTYTPNAGYYGSDSFTYKANNSAGDSNTASVNATVTYSVDPNSIVVTPSSLTFPPVVLGYGTPSQRVTLTNKSTAAISVTLDIPAGFGTYSNNCTGSIAPAASCSIYVASVPRSLDQVSGTLSIYYGGVAPKAVALAGTPMARLDVSTPSLSFPDTTLGAGSSSKTVNIFNRTGASVTVLPSIDVSDFILSANNCPAPLPAFVGCTIWVRFEPKSAAALSGTLTLTAGSITQQVNLSGNGVGSITFDKSAMVFAPLALGQGSTSQMVTLFNNSGSPITVAPSISGEFIVSANGCTGTIPAGGAQCYIWVRFTPKTNGPLIGTLTINANGSPVGTVSLSGTGVGSVTLNKPVMVFAPLAVGLGSSSQMVTLFNNSGVPITVTPSITGDFMVSANSCTGTIAAGGAQCYIWVRFTPHSNGPVNGTLTVTPSAGSPQTVTLLGSNYVVDAAGSGDFTSVQAAVNALPAGGGVISIKPGTYTEVVNIASPNVQLRGLGSDPSQVVITYNNYNGNSGGSTSASATVTVSGDNFYAENLTMQNTHNMEVDQAIANSQAVALYVKGDRAVFRNMRFIGRQDTLYTSSKTCSGTCTPARQYFYNSYIEGNVDYIFGDGASVFDSCTIHTVRHEDITTHVETGATVTAQSKRYAAQYSGYVFTNSTFESGPVPAGELGHSSLDVGYDITTGLPYADRTKSKVYLGRPWAQQLPYSTVVIMNSNLNFLINPAGWESWSGAPTNPPQADLLTSTYAEYNNTMVAGATGPRESAAITLTAATAAQYATKTFLAGSDNWDPTAIK
jgi:pectinesterase